MPSIKSTLTVEISYVLKALDPKENMLRYEAQKSISIYINICNAIYRAVFSI